jgi:hemophore-related protein
MNHENVQQVSLNQRLARGVAVLGAVVSLATAAPAAADEPAPPNCTAGDFAGVMTGVSAAMSAYLLTHPDVNAFFTDLKGKPRDEQRQAVQDYIDANPQVGAELRGIRAPAVEFRDRCDVELPE